MVTARSPQARPESTFASFWVERNHTAIDPIPPSAATYAFETALPLAGLSHDCR